MKELLPKHLEGHAPPGSARPHGLEKTTCCTDCSLLFWYEAGRTHLDLAALAHAQGHQKAAATHLQAAHAVFTALQVPRYVARTAQLAGAYGVTLAEEPS